MAKIDSGLEALYRYKLAKLSNCELIDLVMEYAKTFGTRIIKEHKDRAAGGIKTAQKYAEKKRILQREHKKFLKKHKTRRIRKSLQRFLSEQFGQKDDPEYWYTGGVVKWIAALNKGETIV
jgi:uncharacterized protein YllA (UPF0747 family)